MSFGIAVRLRNFETHTGSSRLRYFRSMSHVIAINYLTIAWLGSGRSATEITTMTMMMMGVMKLKPEAAAGTRIRVCSAPELQR